VALGDSGEGYVWRPLLSEDEEAPPAPAEAVKPEEPAPPSEIIIASGPLLGLTLADWLLLSSERLKAGEHSALIGEATELRARHGRLPDVEAVLQQAVIGDLEQRKGMARVVYAASYRRQLGAFDALDAYLDKSVAIVLSELEPVTVKNARAALDASEKLKSVSGTTRTTLSLEARAYHALEDYENAEAAYGAWLKATAPGDAEREQMVAAMLRAMSGESLDPQDDETFRDCPECPELIIVPVGEFMMGSPENEAERNDNEGPVHLVSVRLPYAIGKYEVMLAEWDACVAAGGCSGYRPDNEGWGRVQRPVINVSYADAKAYTAWLSRKTGHGYRLPSEAEWEYAARAGTNTRYHFGNSINLSQANFGSSKYKTVPVGSYPSNAFGLHDVHGNVWEWTEDCWNESYAGAPSDTIVWKAGDCHRRVLRGGSWSDISGNIRLAYRHWLDIRNRNISNGFRVVRTLQ
jgi:formylglycine-generating enzyme required for sulfatase activity